MNCAGGGGKRLRLSKTSCCGTTAPAPTALQLIPRLMLSASVGVHSEKSSSSRSESDIREDGRAPIEKYEDVGLTVLAAGESESRVGHEGKAQA